MTQGKKKGWLTIIHPMTTMMTEESRRLPDCQSLQNQMDNSHCQDDSDTWQTNQDTVL